MNQFKIYTIGHSNHAIDRFLALLKEHEIEALVDVRRFPSSRRLPHFNRPNLAGALEEHDIEYHWLESLGGHREEGLADSPNFGIKDESFRNYADHMLCAEKSFHDCHRKLTSDFLVANGVTVQHILANGTLEAHRLSDGAKVEEGKVTYPESHPLFD